MRAALVVVAAAAAVLSAAFAAPRPEEPAPRQEPVPILILGTYHFANPNRDLVKTDFDDHGSERRQSEIREVAELLARFAPTKIAIESPPGDALQREYDAYRKGERDLRVNESEQLGMRLAKSLGHERIFGIDSPLDLDLDGVMGAAQRSGRTALLSDMGRTMQRVQALQESLSKKSVRDALIAINDPELLPIGRDMYLRLTIVRDGEKPVGADQIARWYQRNFRMFSHLAAAIESPEDRVLVIVGAGHCPLLRELVQADPNLRLAEPLDYLKPR